ncbi:tautomerase family protein [Nitrogeniibacter aestuarii]|uniref:tautomerase family protein n=1 Tax=Nitrogeniibacter aestuarii TaxID=2815343 RepID=UPI001D101691|nr:4-oxalocrotonate tautomerase family protein [Nitrogeniibacter aestuarii]
MPIINVKVSAQRSNELAQRIADMLSDLTSRILHKDPAVTAIAIDFISPHDWFAGGRSLAAQGRNSVYFDIKITDETNTKAEKAAYISASFAAFEALIGPLHEESYIYVQDVRASAYGYGGQTQEWRYHHS